MEFSEIIDKAKEVRNMYSQLEKEKYGKNWGTTQLMQGFVGDVGDLSKLITAKDGLRDIDEVDEKLEHELADCLWAILVLANEYDIDIEKSFLKTMDELKNRIKN